MPPPFDPPKPTISTGLLTLLDVMDTQLHTGAFSLALHASFVEVGLLPKPDGSYVKFSYNKKGYLTSHIPLAPETTRDDVGPTFGETATGIEVTNRLDDDGGSDDDDSSDDSGSNRGEGDVDADDMVTEV